MRNRTGRATVSYPQPQENPPADATIALRYLVPEGHKLYHLLNFIDHNYGSNPANIIKAVSAILDFNKSLKYLKEIKGSPVNSTFNLFKFSLPATLYGIELALKIKRYINEINTERLSEYDKALQRVKDFLDIKQKENVLYKRTDYLNEEITLWLLTSPKTEGYKISGYYSNLFEIIEKVSLEPEQQEINIFLEYKKEKIILNLKINKAIDFIHLDSQYVSKNFSSAIQVIEELESLIINDYIRTFDTQKNILEYRQRIILKKRSKVNENINQYDVPSLIAEIKKVLKHGRKRGYGFIGLHGTGKSIILKKIEEVLTNYPIIRLGLEGFSDAYTIKKCFKLIRMIQPAVVFIEDMDALGFKEKNERAGIFINEIDDINNDLNIVLIITINDTKLVHRTIIDRPGRFDEIIEIKSPQSSEEAYEVMRSKFDKLKSFYTQFKEINFPSQNDLEEILQRCLKNKFTQAELTCGIIEKVFINTDKPSNNTIVPSIEKAVTFFEASKRNLKNYSFNEKIEFDEEPKKMEVQESDVSIR